MDDSTVAGDAPLGVLFPQYRKMASMLRGEISGLDDSALDWTGDQFGFAGWSIRQQASHLASVVYRWLLVRWSDQLFPDGIPVLNDELARLSSDRYDRRLDDDHYWTADQIVGAAEGAMQLAQSVLARVTVSEGRSLVVSRTPTPQWHLMVKAHPRGVTLDEDGGGTMTLEATFRHMYFEWLTHMYNMHRIKNEIGLPVIVRLPPEGYHTVRGWD